MALDCYRSRVFSYPFNTHSKLLQNLNMTDLRKVETRLWYSILAHDHIAFTLRYPVSCDPYRSLSHLLIVSKQSIYPSIKSAIRIQAVYLFLWEHQSYSVTPFIPVRVPQTMKGQLMSKNMSAAQSHKHWCYYQRESSWVAIGTLVFWMCLYQC